MKTIGIIGGLGPQTTAEFYITVGNLFAEYSTGTRPRILIESVPLPLDIEREAIIEAKGAERCIPYLVGSARTLEAAGADVIVMPCNSLHLFIEDIRKAVHVPVLSIVEETANFLEQNTIREVGVISTAITRDNQLYESLLIKHGITPILPDGYQQAKLGAIIHRLVNGTMTNADRQALIDTIDQMTQTGVEHVILACTDLQLLLPSHGRATVYDTMQILASATTKRMVD